MERAPGEGLEDDEVEGAAEEFQAGFWHEGAPEVKPKVLRFDAGNPEKVASGRDGRSLPLPPERISHLDPDGPSCREPGRQQNGRGHDRRDDHRRRHRKASPASIVSGNAISPGKGQRATMAVRRKLKVKMVTASPPASIGRVIAVKTGVLASRRRA